MKVIFVIISIALIVVACKKEQDHAIIYGYEYFPIDSGHYVAYDVLDIIHDDLSGVHDTDYYQIKEVIGEEEIDLEGESSKKMYRYKRASDTLAWSLKDVWIVKKSNRSVELVEENQRKIKMAFSISYDQYWDCNALNEEDENICYYRNIYQPLSIGAIDYDSTVVIEHEDNLNVIHYTRAFEVYSKNVGKVQYFFKDIDINEGDTTQVLKGTEFHYTAFDYGTE